MSSRRRRVSFFVFFLHSSLLFVEVSLKVETKVDRLKSFHLHKISFEEKTFLWPGGMRERNEHVIDTIINRLDCYLTIINSLVRRPFNIEAILSKLNSRASAAAASGLLEENKFRNRQLNMRFCGLISRSRS